MLKWLIIQKNATINLNLKQSNTQYNSETLFKET